MSRALNISPSLFICSDGPIPVEQRELLTEKSVLNYQRERVRYRDVACYIYTHSMMVERVNRLLFSAIKGTQCIGKPVLAKSLTSDLHRPYRVFLSALIHYRNTIYEFDYYYLVT